MKFGEFEVRTYGLKELKETLESFGELHLPMVPRRLERPVPLVSPVRSRVPLTVDLVPLMVV